MKLLFSVVWIISTLIFVSCQKLIEPANSNAIYGYWIYSTNIDSVQVFNNSTNFEKDKPGIAFKENGAFIERTSGFCATPPLSFYNIQGKWEKIDQKKIEIISKNWSNEDYSRIMNIVSLTAHELRVIFYY